MWFTASKTSWMSPLGKTINRFPKDKILESQEARDWGELNWIDTAIHQPDSQMGFIAPDGRYYGCTDHHMFAYLFLRSNLEELGEAGWVKTWWNSWQCSRRLTPEQRRTLRNRNFYLMETD